MKSLLLSLLLVASCSSLPKKIETEYAPAALGPYSQAVEARGMVYVSGQLGINPATKKAPDSIEEQTRQVMENLKAILKAAGTDLKSVVKTTIYLRSFADFKKVNEIYGAYFAEGTFPARSTVEVGAFPQNFLIEIDATAVKK